MKVARSGDRALQGAFGGDAGPAGVAGRGGCELLHFDESAAAHCAGEIDAVDMGDAAAESFQGVPTLLKLLVPGRAFVGEEVAAESGEGEGVFQEDGEGGDGAAQDQVV